jgi:hypothetical protein
MIRFVDVRDQGLCHRFSFWDTVKDSYIEINSEVAWNNWDDFLEIAKNNDMILRFKGLCPEWVFDGMEDKIEKWYET